MDQESMFNAAATATWERLEDEMSKASPSTRRLLAHIREHLFDPGYGAAALRGALPDVDDDQMERFSAEVGGPVTVYITEARLETAARLLRDTTLPIATISLLVGYTEGATFRQLSKSTFGVSPRELRGRLRSQILRLPAATSDPLTVNFWQRLWNGKQLEDQRRRALELLRRIYPSDAAPVAPPLHPEGAAELESLAGELQQELERRPAAAQHDLRRAIGVDTSALLPVLRGDNPSGLLALEQARRLGEAVAVPFLRHQFQWLAGITWERLEGVLESERLLQQARAGFLELRALDHAAAVSLELACLHHRQALTPEVMSLASEAIPVLQAFVHSPEALAAADQLRQAIIADDLTLEIVDRSRDCLRRLLLESATLLNPRETRRCSQGSAP